VLKAYFQSDKKGKFNMDFWENIESYINNDLSEAERKVFEKAMATDATLQQSVNEQRLIINLLRQKNDTSATSRTTVDTLERKRLKSIIDSYIAKLPDAPVEMPEKDTKGVIIPLNPKLPKEDKADLVVVKKTNIWWRAAAAIAVVAAASIWLYIDNTNTTSPEPIIVQTPVVTPSIDSSKKIDVPKPETTIANQQKQTPQYQTPKKPEPSDVPVKLNPSPPIPPFEPETQANKDAVLAVVENVADKEYQQIKEPTKGTSSNELSREDQTLLTALEAISANKPKVALEVLQNRTDEKARYYRALAYLLIDKTRGKNELEALAKDGDLETYFRNKIKDLLNKL
jgi:hypothetical protein